MISFLLTKRENLLKLLNYRKCVFEFPYNLIGQLNNGFSIGPNIARTQILIDNRRPKARISALARRMTLTEV